ncbi:hypothetical protein JCM10207_001325 [Rhodosporidiobolus poonsookiae]
MAPNRVTKVVIVGGGISGIATGVRLQEALGKACDFTIYERADDVGGVWRDSKWPGAAVDVPIHLYSLYSHLNPSFSSKWAGRDEVLGYWKRIVARHQLQSHFVFHSEFVSSRWDTPTQRHTVTFRNVRTGETFEVVADILISATGALNKPIFPKLPGRDRFKGVQWHSSQWDTEIDLRNKRVAIVGNGSTAIQALPNIADLEGIEIVQFIRSPGYFRPKVNFEYSGLKRFIFRYVPFALRLYRWKLFYEYDRNILSRGNGSWTSALREKAASNILGYMRSQLPEKYWPAVIPEYPMHCKRVAYDAGWLASLDRPNVDLIASPLAEVTETGLVTKDGRAFDFDVIVWATGFEVSETGVGLNHGVYGEDGKELRETWKEAKGAYGYLGVAVPKVPNYFCVLGPNAIAMSWGWSFSVNSLFISRLVKEIHRRDLSSIVVKDDVMQSYNASLQARLEQTSLASSACGGSWYKDPTTGKLVAPAPWNATELWTRQRKIKWEDWQCRRLVAGAPVTVDVRTPTTWTPWGLFMDLIASRIQRFLISLMTDGAPDAHGGAAGKIEKVVLEKAVVEPLEKGTYGLETTLTAGVQA